MKKCTLLFVCLMLSWLAPFQSLAVENPSVSTRDDVASVTGWWWEGEAKTGAGISIEQQGSRLYLAWYVYDDAGRPVWYSALMDGESNLFSGILHRATGWPLETDSPQSGFTAEAVGTISLNVISDDEATLAYNDGTAHSKNITRFLSGLMDTRNIQGWWWDPNHEGMGVFIESRGKQLFAAWYNYREDGSPRWWITIDGFTQSDPTYEGELFQYANGQTLTGDWAMPDLDASKGPVSIQFHGQTAILQWPGFSYPLQRFVFGELPWQRIIPDTGILLCFDGDYPIWPLPGDFLYGQDAQYNPPARQLSYNDNGDGSVTDNVTGLLWMKSDDGNDYSWEEARNYCEDLDLAGHSDWRLPDRHELIGLLKMTKSQSDLPIEPGIEDSVFDCRTVYWSNDAYVGDPETAWAVFFNRGVGTSRLSLDGPAYVRCVRGN